jgi:hypothetical protein
VWRASARAGIRHGAALERDATVNATRRLGQPALIPIANAFVPRSGLAAMIAAAVVLALLYATSSSVLDPVGTWFGVASGVGIAGALVSAWEGRHREEAPGGAHGRPVLQRRTSMSRERDTVGFAARG